MKSIKIEDLIWKKININAKKCDEVSFTGGKFWNYAVPLEYTKVLYIFYDPNFNIINGIDNNSIIPLEIYNLILGEK